MSTFIPQISKYYNILTLTSSRITKGPFTPETVLYAEKNNIK